MRRRGGQDRAWRPVLALLVVLVLPWLVGSAAPGVDTRTVDAHALAVSHVDQSRAHSAPGGQRATALVVASVPFASVGLDAVYPAAPASSAPPRFWHGHVAAASSDGACVLAASRGRSPPATAL